MVSVQRAAGSVRQEVRKPMTNRDPYGMLNAVCMPPVSNPASTTDFHPTRSFFLVAVRDFSSLLEAFDPCIKAFITSSIVEAISPFSIERRLLCAAGVEPFTRRAAGADQ